MECAFQGRLPFVIIEDWLADEFFDYLLATWRRARHGTY